MRRIKSLGLGALMALALLALPAVASAKGGFTAAQYPASLEAKTGSTPVLGLQLGQMTCDRPTLTATATEPSGTLSATLSDSGCYISGAKQPLKMNGCKFIFNGGDGSKGTFDIGPAGCGPIKFESPTYCNVTIGSQNGLAATYANAGSGSKATVTVGAQATGIKYTSLGGASCAKGNYSNGSYSASWNVEARNAKAEQVGFKAGSVGLSIGGSPLKFQAESYPVPASGSTNQLSFGTVLGSAYCEAGTIKTGLGSASSEVLVVPQYEKCAFAGFGGTVVKQNGCLFLFKLHNVAPPYTGDASLGCEGENELEITNVIFGVPICKVTIGSHIGLEGVTYATAGTGSTAGIQATMKLTGIKYTVVNLLKEGEGNGCFDGKALGTHEDGTFTGTTTVYSF